MERPFGEDAGGNAVGAQPNADRIAVNPIEAVFVEMSLECEPGRAREPLAGFGERPDVVNG